MLKIDPFDSCLKKGEAMSVGPLTKFLTDWTGSPFIEAGGQKELVTKVALQAICAGDEGVLRGALHKIVSSNRDLMMTCTEFENLLNKAHGKSISDIEFELGFVGWDGGPGMKEAKKRILSAYFETKGTLDLNGLELHSLPSGIKDLKIAFLECPKDLITETTVLPECLLYLNGEPTPLEIENMKDFGV